MRKKLWMLIGIGLLLVTVKGYAEQAFNLQFKDKSFSVAIKDVPLNQVLKKMEQEKGIWFKCPDAVLEAKVFARFEDKTFEKGLEQIIAPLNYSLVFKKGKIEGVIIVDKGQLSPGFKLGSSVARQTPPPPNPFKAIRNAPPPGGDTPVTEEDREPFKVMPNTPVPGGPVIISEEERKLFKMKKQMAGVDKKPDQEPGQNIDEDSNEIQDEMPDEPVLLESDTNEPDPNASDPENETEEPPSDTGGQEETDALKKGHDSAVE